MAEEKTQVFILRVQLLRWASADEYKEWPDECSRHRSDGIGSKAVGNEQHSLGGQGGTEEQREAGWGRCLPSSSRVRITSEHFGTYDGRVQVLSLSLHTSPPVQSSVVKYPWEQRTLAVHWGPG